MKVGGKRTLLIPPQLGYGAHGTAGGLIPPERDPDLRRGAARRQVVGVSPCHFAQDDKDLDRAAELPFRSNGTIRRAGTPGRRRRRRLLARRPLRRLRRRAASLRARAGARGFRLLLPAGSGTRLRRDRRASRAVRAGALPHPRRRAARRASRDDARASPSRSGLDAREDGAPRSLRRLPAPRGDRRVPHAGRARRDPPRDDPDARDRQPAEGVLLGQRGALRAASPFQGKGFRSLGQEAIYAAPLRLRRGAALSRAGRHLARRRRRAAHPRPRRGARDAARTRSPCAWSSPRRWERPGRPMDGQGPPRRRLLLGSPARVRAARDLRRSRSPGIAMAFARDGSRPRRRLVHRRGRHVARRVARGDQPLRRAAAARRSSASQNNQTALSTPVADQSAVRVFADKAAGYGIPGITIDGTDPEAIAAAFAWAAERARGGRGPGADRARLHAHVRPRAPRRHALSRQGAADLVGLPRARRRAATPIASSTRSGRGATRSPRYAARLEAEGVDRARGPRAVPARGGGARRGGGAQGHRRAVAGAGGGRARASSRARRRAAAASRSSPRSARGAAPAALPPARAGPAVRPEGTDVPRSRHARRRRRARAPTRASSSTARTSAASTATPSCSCGRCSKSSATGS